MTESLAGRHIILTAGPTLEPIDPVRFISNRSSGKQGYALAEALAALGARVTLVSGPTALSDPIGVRTIHVETALEMLAAVEQALPTDVFIAVAAVADWRPAERSATKLKLDKSSFASLPLVENPDILKTISHLPANRPSLVIGFAAETHDIEKLATEKRARKGCDWIIANDVSGDVMGGDKNAIHLITKDSIDTWPRTTKVNIARQLAKKVADFVVNLPPRV